MVIIMMKRAYTFLILWTYICFSRGDDPIQTVACDEKGTLTFTLVANPHWNISGNARCGNTHTLQITQKNGSRSIEGCAKGTSVTFELNQHHADGPGVNVSTIPTEKTMSVTLRCDAIQSDTNMDAHLPLITVIATHSVQTTHKNATESITMVMELRDNTESHTVTTSINLSQNYTLLIAGAGNHSTEVTKCTAAGSSSAEEVLIYNQSTPVGSPQVLTVFNRSSHPSEEIDGKKVNKMATLTGFRLVGSDTVNLKCNIKVCAATCTVAKRKRKGGKHQPEVHYAALKLSVRDNVFDTPVSGAADTFPVASSLWSFILMSILLHFIY